MRSRRSWSVRALRASSSADRLSTSTASAHPEMLAAGCGAVHHAAAGHHARSRHRRAQRRHVPHAGHRRAHHRSCTGSCRRPARATGAATIELKQRMPVAVSLGGDPVLRLRRHRAVAGRHRRIHARRLPAQEIRRAGEVRDQRPRSARQLPISSSKATLTRTSRCAMEGPFGDHTGYYTLPEPYPVFHVTAITHRQRRHLSGHHRRHAADGRFLHGQRVA